MTSSELTWSTLQNPAGEERRGEERRGEERKGKEPGICLYGMVWGKGILPRAMQRHPFPLRDQPRDGIE
jgi:hypothetical protein